jgi:hypothetical protein
METNRIGLIRYDAPDSTPCVGSGLLVSKDVVLTADHVADGSNYRVEIRGRSYPISRVLRSGSPAADLAVLMLGESIDDIHPLKCARVDRDSVGHIADCTALGFPRWKREGNNRRSAQVDGIVPTGEGFESSAGEGLNAGFLTLVGNRKPSVEINSGLVTETNSTTPWGGMSGAVVVANGRWIIGVVRSVNLAADGQSLTVTPITAINDLIDSSRSELWAALGVVDPANLTLLPEGIHNVQAEAVGYQYDVYLSYWPESCIEPWVRKRFINPFKKVLVEELGRQPTIMTQQVSREEIGTINNARVLLAVLSKQYFYRDCCRAVFDSMLRRQIEEGFGTDQTPVRLVHAIVAHDFRSDESVPPDYRGTIEPVDFKRWAYDFEIQDWTIYTSYTDAVGELASQVAEAIIHAPVWRAEFPLRTPSGLPQPVPRKPVF